MHTVLQNRDDDATVVTRASSDPSPAHSPVAVSDAPPVRSPVAVSDAPPVRPPVAVPDAPPVRPPVAVPDAAGLDAVADAVDLGPRIEALRAFLARYPSDHQKDAPQAAPVPVPEPSSPVASPSKTPPTVSPDSWPRHDVHDVDVDVVDVNVHQDSLPGVRSAVPVRFAWLRPFAWLRRQWKVAAAAAVVLAVGLALGAMWLLGSNAVEMGALTVETTPAGLTVLIDGATRGVTPINVALTPGDHVVELVTDRDRRRIPVTITAGGHVSQILELSAAASALGELQVRTDPGRASVTVDGQSAGLSPVTVTNLAPGPHTVVLRQESGAVVTEQVLIEAGRTASLVVSMSVSPGTNAAGWISIVGGAADVQVFENGRMLGHSAIDRIMVPVGRHELEIVNEALGYREFRTVQVSPGQVSAVKLAWPRGSLAVNAIPWAEVLIDGQLVGETPLGNVPVPIGVHEVVFRHPTLGERRSLVTVKPGAPAKVGVDLRSR